MKEKLLQYYCEHGPMTEIKTMQQMVSDIPKDIPTIVTYVQNILLHQHWRTAYGVEVSEDRLREPLIWSFADKLVFLNNRGFKHVSEKKNPEEKMIGICRTSRSPRRHFVEKPAFPPELDADSPLILSRKIHRPLGLEYWNEDQQRWVMVDAQLDELQQKALQITFDPLDVGETDFINGPRAWIMCRAGKADPELFGIFQWWGYEYLRCNLILDANSLLKMPMQPWDQWEGYKDLPMEEWTEADFAVMDELASLALAIDDDFEAFAEFVRGNDKIRVPDDLNNVRQFE